MAMHRYYPILAIKLDHPEDPSWYAGPPYAIEEHVFDEDGIECLSLNEKDIY